MGIDSKDSWSSAQSPAVLVNAYANRGDKTVCFHSPERVRR
jgi:hypothetical protein